MAPLRRRKKPKKKRSGTPSRTGSPRKNSSEKTPAGKKSGGGNSNSPKKSGTSASATGALNDGSLSVYVRPWALSSTESENNDLAASHGDSLSSSKASTIANTRLLVFYLLFGYLVLFFTNCTIRVGHWKNREVLFSVDAYYWPMGLKSHHQIGTVYHRMNMFDKALWHYEKSLSIHDDNALTDYCIAQAYIETSQFDKAQKKFEKIFKGHGIGFAGYNTFALF